jgi:hypothetical protein
MVATSGLSVRHHGHDTAQLRLSWRARPERIESCRVPSPEELAAVAEHMRQRMICTGVEASYALRVTVDGRLLTDDVVRGGGLRHDRPLSVLRNIEVPPGPHRIVVSLRRRERDTARDSSGTPTAEPDTGLYAGRAAREASERSRRTLAAIPAELLLDSTVSFTTGRVVLVTIDPDRRQLRVMQGGH